MHETGDREGNQGEKRSEMDQKNRLGQAERQKGRKARVCVRQNGDRMNLENQVCGSAVAADLRRIVKYSGDDYSSIGNH